MLERGRPRRKFRRLSGPVLAQLLGQSAPPAPSGSSSGPDAPRPDEREKSPPTELAGGSHEPSGPEPGEPLL